MTLKNYQSVQRAVNRRREQPEHVKLVGDELRVREEAAGKAAVRVRHVERDPAHVLASGDVLEGRAELCAALAFNKLHQALVFVVDDHRHEAPLFEAEIMLEKMLVDADLRRPRIQTRATFELQLLVEHAMHEP